MAARQRVFAEGQRILGGVDADEQGARQGGLVGAGGVQQAGMHKADRARRAKTGLRLLAVRRHHLIIHRPVKRPSCQWVHSGP